jgi:hypothetical protein
MVNGGLRTHFTLTFNIKMTGPLNTVPIVLYILVTLPFLAPFHVSAALTGLRFSVLMSSIGARRCAFLADGLMSTIVEERFGLYVGLGGFWDITGGGVVFITSLGFWEMDTILDRVCFLSGCLQKLLCVLMGLAPPEGDWDDMLSDNEDDDNQSVGSI